MPRGARKGVLVPLPCRGAREGGAGSVGTPRGAEGVHRLFRSNAARGAERVRRFRGYAAARGEGACFINYMPWGAGGCVLRGAGNEGVPPRVLLLSGSA